MVLSKSKVSDYNFSDLRLSKRFIRIRTKLSTDLSLSIPQAMQNKHQTKLTYSFFKNKKVNPEQIYKDHQTSLRPRIKTYYNRLASFGGQKPHKKSNFKNPTKRILALSDTVELDYRNKQNAKSLGPLTTKRRRGLLAHNTLLINDLGSPLDLLNQKFIIRKDEDFGKSKERKYYPIEAKESYKWYQHFVDSQNLLKSLNSQTEQSETPYEMVYIADREGDIKELFQERQESNMHYIIRSQFNRSLLVETLIETTDQLNKSPQTVKLKDFLNMQQVQLQYPIQITHPKTKKKRTAEVQLKYHPIKLKMNKSFGAKYYKKNNIAPPNRPYKETLDIYCVEVKEVNPPSDIEKPIHWILLTSLPVNNIEDALQVVDYYVLRWIIERFHYLLKTGGANIENLNFKENHQLINALITYSFAAMDVLTLKYLAEKQPDLPIYQAGISSKEYQALYEYVHLYADKKVTYNPDIEPTIKEFVINLGKIGGFIPSKRKPTPGLKILSYAYQKFNIILDTFNLFCQRTN